MKKPLFLLMLALTTASSFSYAGGNGKSWAPSVMPINCIHSSSYWYWSGSKECNKVIKKGYAQGVRYKGAFKYSDGSLGYFDGIITPTQNLNSPKPPAGVSIVGFRYADASWYK